MTIHRKLLIGALLAVSCLDACERRQTRSTSHVASATARTTRAGRITGTTMCAMSGFPAIGVKTRYDGRVWVRGRYVARERRGPLDQLERRHRIHRSMMFGGSY